MPNWCQNNVTFRHKDPAMLERVVKGFRGDGLFKEFFPTPPELVESTSPPPSEEVAAEFFEKFGVSSWYEWNLTNWGVKWDVYNSDDESVDVVNNEVQLSFDTAWNPPEEFFSRLSEELGFDIEAYYWEPGMDFCGKWTTDCGDESYEGDDIPAEIDMIFGISEWKAECAADEEEEV